MASSTILSMRMVGVPSAPSATVSASASRSNRLLASAYAVRAASAVDGQHGTGRSRGAVRDVGPQSPSSRCEV